MIALLLAQLVMPSPSVEPLSPPGMVCMGECSDEPMVWRASPARGRLVVACDMRSDTCSDGRTITTVRASPVPCETSPGVWQTIPEDTGCYSVRGLESWAQNTSYLSWGAELDRGPWVGAAVPASQGYQITGPLSQSMAAVGVSEQRTTAWILRADTPRLVTIGVQPTGGCEVEVGTEWRTYSCTEQVAIGVSPEARITQPVGQSVYGIAAWHTRSDTPGRPCWGGEAPVTCAADRHTISTEGWPTESGEISLVYTPQGVGIGSAMYLVATTNGSSGSPSGIYLYRISASGALVFGLRRGATISAQVTQDLAWENGRSYHVRVRWSPERAEIFRDGVRVRSWVPTTVPDSHPDVAHIGTNTVGTSPAQGAISSLRVRSFE